MKNNTSCNFNVANIPNTLGSGLKIGVPGTMGFANSKGDYNNDGIDDIIFTAATEGSSYNAAYVIYGSKNFNQSVIDLKNLTPNVGFGIVFDKLTKPCSYSPLITSIDSGFDINHDGIDDLYVSVICNGKYGYAIYGRTEQFPVQYVYLSDLPQSYYDIISYNAIPVGDINGDGFKDLVVPGNSSKKVSSEVNCQTQVTYILGQNDPVNLFFETGCTIFDDWYIVPTASLGDVNGDGLADIAVSNPYSANNLVHYSGSTYVIYGTKSPKSFSINNITPEQGYLINGYEINQMCGQTLNYIGSINGDEIDDISLSCGNGNIFVVYGQKGNNVTSIDLSTINASTGLFANASSFTKNDIIAFGGVDSFTNQNVSSFMFNLPQFTGNCLPIIFEGQYKYPFPFDLNSGNYVKITNSDNAMPYASAYRDIGDVNGDNLTDITISFSASSPQQAEDIYVIFGNASFFDCV